MIVHIDPACDIFYSAYYIHGFKKLGHKVRFTNKYFTKFKFNNHFLAVVLEEKNKFTNIIIDFNDGSKLDLNAYAWSDTYYKINIKFGDLSYYQKLKSITPSFGIKIFNLPTTVGYSVVNYLKSYKRIKNLKKYFSNYKAMISRLELQKYSTPISDDKSYIFFISTIWKNEPKTNLFRLNFIKACKSLTTVKFEGGFAPRKDKNNLMLDEYVTDSRVTIDKFLENTKKSLLVFNTPAVLDCHGWKLAEYLALGKVIISTKISRELPVNLVNMEEILITDGTVNHIEELILMIQNNEELYNKLSNNALNYFKEFVSPTAVCTRILNK